MDELFDYFIKVKGELVVASFSGSLDKTAREKFTTLSQEIKEFEDKTVILYFNGVSKADASIYRELSLLQQDCRKKNKALFLVGLNHQLKQHLLEKGIIRSHEVRSSLEEILPKKT